MAKLGIKIEPIVPKKPVIDMKYVRRVDTVMRQSGGDLAGVMRQYPPRLPWKKKPDGSPGEPKTGLRAGGRRTGNLGLNWNLRNGRGFYEVFNTVAYAGFVQGFLTGKKGKRQTEVMRRRNWRNLTAVSKTEEARLNGKLRLAFRNRR